MGSQVHTTMPRSILDCVCAHVHACLCICVFMYMCVHVHVCVITFHVESQAEVWHPPQLLSMLVFLSQGLS